MANEKVGYLFGPGMAPALGIIRDCFPRWFGHKAHSFANYNNDIYWLPWTFFMEDEAINKTKEDLVANLFNEKALKELQGVLFRKNKLNDKISDFDLTLEHPLQWNRFAIQQRPHDFYWSFTAPLNPRYWALGNFSIYALPKGTVIPLDGGGHRIMISDIYLYIHDTFNFEGQAFLGPWDFKNKKFPSLSTRTQFLGNSTFNNFRNRHGFGRDFTLLSPLYRLPGFKGLSLDVGRP